MAVCPELSAMLTSAPKSIKNLAPSAFLHFACAKGYKDIVKMLLDKGANASIISNQSITPLHFAAKSGHKEVLQLILDAGADINATDKQGKTPLIYAIEAKKADGALKKQLQHLFDHFDML